MLGRDRTQHGRKKQHGADGGAHLHHGTGSTCTWSCRHFAAMIPCATTSSERRSQCVYAWRYSVVLPTWENKPPNSYGCQLLSMTVNGHQLFPLTWGRTVYPENYLLRHASIILLICLFAHGVSRLQRDDSSRSPALCQRHIPPFYHRWAVSSRRTLQTCIAWTACTLEWGPEMILRLT